MIARRRACRAFRCRKSQQATADGLRSQRLSAILSRLPFCIWRCRKSQQVTAVGQRSQRMSAIPSRLPSNLRDRNVQDDRTWKNFFGQLCLVRDRCQRCLWSAIIRVLVISMHHVEQRRFLSHSCWPAGLCVNALTLTMSSACTMWSGIFPLLFPSSGIITEPCSRASNTMGSW